MCVFPLKQYLFSETPCFKLFGEASLLDYLLATLILFPQQSALLNLMLDSVSPWNQNILFSGHSIFTTVRFRFIW